MSIYIEDREGNTYNFKKLSYRQTAELQKGIKDFSKDELVEETVYKIFTLNYPEITKEKFDDILEYNNEVIGYENLVILLSGIVKEVFQSTGTNPNKYSFLEKLREEIEKEKN